jgi:hypothetical protein
MCSFLLLQRNQESRGYAACRDTVSQLDEWLSGNLKGTVRHGTELADLRIPRM